MKKIILILGIGIMFLFNGCTRKDVSNEESLKKDTKKEVAVLSKKPKENNLDILVSNEMLYGAVKSISRDLNKVDYVFRKKGEHIMIGHYFSLAYKPDMYIYDEYNFKVYNDEYINKIQNNKIGIINASRGVKQLSYYKNVSNNTSLDNSYYWNNVDNYKIILLNVKNALIEKNPSNREYYSKNFDELIKKINSFENDFEEVYNKLKDYTFIVEDNSLAYFMGYLGVKTIVINNVNDNIKKGQNNKEEQYKNIKEYREKIVKILKNIGKDRDKIIYLYNSERFKQIIKPVLDEYNVMGFKEAEIDINRFNEINSILEFDSKLFSKLIEKLYDIPK